MAVFGEEKNQCNHTHTHTLLKLHATRIHSTQRTVNPTILPRKQLIEIGRLCRLLIFSCERLIFFYSRSTVSRARRTRRVFLVHSSTDFFLLPHGRARRCFSIHRWRPLCNEAMTNLHWTPTRTPTISRGNRRLPKHFRLWSGITRWSRRSWESAISPRSVWALTSRPVKR